MPRQSLSINRRTSDVRVSQTKTATPQTLSRRLRELLVKRMIGKPKSMLWTLQTWEPGMKGGAELLQLLTEQMTLKWWERRSSVVKAQILRELIRIDDGRGIIADWLALIVRKENDLSVLEEAVLWASQKYRFTDRLLDAWCERSFDGLSNGCPDSWCAVRVTALKMITSAILPSGTSSEPVDEKKSSEERRAGIILRHVARSLHGGQTLEELEIIANWEPSPELHGKGILSEIFCEWERRMKDIENLPSNWIGVYNKKRGLQLIWKGLVRLSPYCKDTDNKLLSWMGHWMQRGEMITPEIAEEMARWNPRDEVVKRKVATLWSKYLLSPDGYENPAVWAAVGRYVAECRRAGSEMDEICRNCLAALDLVSKSRNGRSAGKVLEAIVCPPCLTAEQQAEWERLWVSLMQSASRDTLGPVVRHLLGLVAAGRTDPNVVKKTILDAVLNKPDVSGGGEYEDNVAVIIGELINKIGQCEDGQNSPGEIFHDMWVQLRQSPWWESYEVRENTIKTLGTCLKRNLSLGKKSPRLVALWLEILREERNLASATVIDLLRKEQSEIMKVCSGFCPDSVEVWRDWTRDRNPRIRETAWELVLLPGGGPKNETKAFLLERLQKEDDLHVLYVMTKWKPSPGEPFPEDLREGWANRFQEIAGDVFQSFVSERIGEAELEEKLGKIIIIEAYFTGNLVIASLEEQSGWDEQPAKLADLRRFWETMVETTKSFLCGMTAFQVERMQKNMDALFLLAESPEKFLKSFAGLRCRYEDMTVWLWENLIESLEGRDAAFLTVNVKHNLGVVAAYLLDRIETAKYEMPTKETIQKVLMELCGDGTWTPDRIPAGWEEFCHELRRFCTMYDRNGMHRPSELEMKKVCAMARIGSAVKDVRCQRLFRETLYQILDSTGPHLTPVVESMVWCEVAGMCEMAEQSAPDGKGLDETGQQRWLRELLRNDGQTSWEDKGGEGSRKFLNALWAELKDELFSRETRENRRNGRVKALALESGGKAVFAHPHRDRNCPAEVPERLVETEPVGQRARQPSFFFAK